MGAIGYRVPCFSPLTGYRAKTVNEKTGKRRIVFNPNEGFADLPIEVPCGQCIGCKLERSRQWAIRCMHEASMHDENIFITLTYAPEHLPASGSINRKHFQTFMKKYRQYLWRKRKKGTQGTKIRYYHCGEYGENFGRPHYHALIFGHDFPDKIHVSGDEEHKLFKSKELDKIWGLGSTLIGAVTFDSAAYVARYVMKKISGPNAREHYEHINKQTGEITDLEPEYTTMSRRPGIGREWYEKYKKEVYPDDFVIVNGRKMKPPKYYQQFFEIDEKEQYLEYQKTQRAKIKKQKPNNTPERLKVREQCAKAKHQLKARPLEDKNETNNIRNTRR